MPPRTGDGICLAKLVGMNNQHAIQAAPVKPRHNKLEGDKNLKKRAPESKQPAADDDSLMFLPIG